MFHYHVDEFTEKQKQKRLADMKNFDLTSGISGALLQWSETSALPDDGVAENRAAHSTGCSFDGSERFELPLLLLLCSQLNLGSAVRFLPDLWL